MAEAVRIAEQHMLFSDLRLTVYQGFRRRRDAGFRLRMQLLPHAYSLWCIESGRVRFERNEKSASHGCLVLRSPNTTDSYIVEETLSFVGVHFSLEVYGGIDLLRLCSLPLVIQLDSKVFRRILFTVEEILAEQFYQDAVSPIARDGLTRLLLAHLMRQVLPQLGAGGHDQLPISQPVQRAITYIWTHYNRNIRNEDIASAAGCSGSHLQRCFRNELGVSPYRYLLKMRLGIARQYLVSSSMTVTEIAERVGFEDPCYFSKVFKRFVGMSPCEFRHRSGDDRSVLSSYW